MPLTPLTSNILQRRMQFDKPFMLTKGILNAKWQKALKYLKLNQDTKFNNKLNWHSLRHTFASYAIMGLHSWQNNQPMPVTHLQKWLGHSDIKMTMRYSHLQIEHLKIQVKDFH